MLGEITFLYFGSKASIIEMFSILSWEYYNKLRIFTHESGDSFIFPLVVSLFLRKNSDNFFPCFDEAFYVFILRYLGNPCFSIYHFSQDLSSVFFLAYFLRTSLTCARTQECSWMLQLFIVFHGDAQPISSLSSRGKCDAIRKGKAEREWRKETRKTLYGLPICVKLPHERPHFGCAGYSRRKRKGKLTIFVDIYRICFLRRVCSYAESISEVTCQAEWNQGLSIL